jgi:glycosyltransferase involved in cell wall biosynthesis
VHLKWSELSKYVIPTKTLAYLASGKRIVMAMHGAAADLVRAAGAGCMVPAEDPAALAEGIRQLAGASAAERRKMSESGRQYLLKYLSRDVVVARYRAVLDRLCAPPAVCI